MHALIAPPAAGAELAGAAGVDAAGAELAGAAGVDAAGAELGAAAGVDAAAAGALLVGAPDVFLLLEQAASMIATVPVAAMI